MVVPEVGYRAPVVPADYEMSVQDGIQIYISKQVRLHGPQLRVRVIRGLLGKKIEVEGIQLVPGGR